MPPRLLAEPRSSDHGQCMERRSESTSAEHVAVAMLTAGRPIDRSVIASRAGWTRYLVVVPELLGCLCALLLPLVRQLGVAYLAAVFADFCTVKALAVPHNMKKRRHWESFANLR